MQRPSDQMELSTLSAIGQDFGHIPLHSKTTARFQAKLMVSTPGDVYEQEADRVADQVMGGSASSTASTVARMTTGALLRKEASPQDFVDSVAPLEMAMEEELSTPGPQSELQRSSMGGAPTVTSTFERSLQQSRLGGGEPLPQGTRTFMESRFGKDFAEVRVHRDAPANALAQGVNARAFTVGTDIYFHRSAYQPDSTDGQRLIAHELTHVLQQAGSEEVSPRQIQRQPISGNPCSAYNGYTTSINVATYNCAGLALRNYQYLSPASTVVQTLVATYPNGGSVACGNSCGAGRLKFWLWEYALHFEDDQGTQLSQPSQDFHIVAGATDQSGNDPTDVYSKNGARPVEGPGTGPGFHPPAWARTLSNDASAQPVTQRGRPVFSVRTNFSESCFCANC